MKKIQTLFTYATAALLTNEVHAELYPPSRENVTV
jgi:hypothetical protein